MRILAIVVASLLAAGGVAAADGRADLQAKGEQLAKDGRFGEAIDAFKAADRIEARASHACLIALAYTRRELWPQAELFLSVCHQRAKAGDPLPEWVPLADQQIRERLQTANVVEVAIEVNPPGSNARVTVSSFAPDEVFDPRTIHLPPGTHVIFVKATGYPDKQHTLVLADKTPQRVVIELAAPAGGTADLAPGPAATKRPSRLGLYVMVGGGVVGLAGVGSHIVMAGRRNTLRLAPDEAAYDAAEGPFVRSRNLTIGLYAASAALLVTGYLLRRSAHKEAATLSAIPLAEGGAFVALAWSR